MIHVSFDHAFGLPWGAFEVSADDYAAIYMNASHITRDRIEHWLLTEKGWAMKERTRAKT